MENFRPINLHQTRDFSRKMNATFEFVRQNFKSLGKGILFIAGPPVLLAGALLGSFFQDMMTASFNMGRGGDGMLGLIGSPSFWLQLALMMVFGILSIVATIATINNYILLYEEKQSNKIPTADLWERVKGTFWMYLGTAVLMTVFFLVVYVVLIIFVGILGAIGLTALTVFATFALILFMLYMFYASSLVFIIRTYEKIGFGAALQRSFKLVYGKWWSTFGLITVLYIIVVIASYLFMIPAYALIFVSAFHSLDSGTQVESASGGMGIAITVLFTLYYLAQMLMYALPNVGIAFQYFNLVERKEARGLMNQITNLGEPAPPSSSASEETY